MLKWLTRNDGGRAARAKRRLGSPRGSVFSEFAIVMPIVLLLCSALYELLGFWDMQVMANHTAWQVGRIAMVRGDDGMEFFAKAGQWSKTGIESKAMPDALKDAIKPINDIIKDANRFNNRGNIAAMFLMSTCGIGYFGDSPGKTFTDQLTKLVNGCVDAIFGALPEFLSKALVDAIIERLKIPGLSGESGIGKLIAEGITKLLNAIFDTILRPLVRVLADWFLEFIKAIGIKIDDLFGKGTVAARRSRQIFGAASRISRAPGVTGSEVLTVKESENANFIFAKRDPSQGRLVYPQVADKETTSDGVFVTGAHGWPPNDQALKLIHVEVNWPFERGWLFPVVSGYGVSSTVPVAKGHSMVFTQPNIRCENLLSEGAAAYEEGDYTNEVGSVFQDIADDMKAYLKLVQFGMKYRINVETITLVDEDPNPLHSYTPKSCKPLLDCFGGNKGGDYAVCWSKITGNAPQDELMRILEPFFEKSSYRSRNYFFWEGTTHKRYACGTTALFGWLDIEDRYVRSVNELDYLSVYSKYEDALKKMMAPPLGDLFKAYKTKVSNDKLKIDDLARLQNPSGYATWQKNEADLKEIAKTTDKAYGVIYSFLIEEINEIEDILTDKGGSYAGDDEDPVFDEDDQRVVDEPDKARDEAWVKWRKLKAALKDKLAEIDRAMDGLNSSYDAYYKEYNEFVRKREVAKKKGFAEACLRVMVRTVNPHILDPGNRRAFEAELNVDALQYDIQAATATMKAKAARYKEKISAAYEREKEYGSLLGLKSAKKREKEGKSIDEMVEEADKPGDDKPGTLGPGSDDNDLINKDNQRYENGRWTWR